MENLFIPLVSLGSLVFSPCSSSKKSDFWRKWRCSSEKIGWKKCLRKNCLSKKSWLYSITLFPRKSHWFQTKFPKRHLFQQRQWHHQMLLLHPMHHLFNHVHIHHHYGTHVPTCIHPTGIIHIWCNPNYHHHHNQHMDICSYWGMDSYQEYGQTLTENMLHPPKPPLRGYLGMSLPWSEPKERFLNHYNITVWQFFFHQVKIVSQLRQKVIFRTKLGTSPCFGWSVITFVGLVEKTNMQNFCRQTME